MRMTSQPRQQAPDETAQTSFFGSHASPKLFRFFRWPRQSLLQLEYPLRATSPQDGQSDPLLGGLGQTAGSTSHQPYSHTCCEALIRWLLHETPIWLAGNNNNSQPLVNCSDRLWCHRHGLAHSSIPFYGAQAFFPLLGPLLINES